MPPIVAGVPNAPKVLIETSDYSATHRAYTPEGRVEQVDVTAFGDLGRRTQPGLLEGSLTLDAYYKSAQTDPDEFVQRLEAALQASGSLVVTTAPEGLVVGRLTHLVLARAVRLGLPISPGEALLAPVELVAQANGLERGVALHDLIAETATGTGTGVDHGAATTAGAVAHLHVPVLPTGTTPTLTVKVQHSVDAVTWVDLITFAAVTTAKLVDRVAITGTVNRHTRAIWTIGGTTPSFTFAVAFARRR